MFPFPEKTPGFDYGLVRVLEHPVRVEFLKLLNARETLSPAEALAAMPDGDLTLSNVTYHARVLEHHDLIEPADDPTPDRGFPFRVTRNGAFALTTLGYAPRGGG
jgi:hypothetical protein